jgi:hypothetical protein
MGTMVLCVGMALWQTPAFAAESRVFTVSRVAVDVTAASATVARGQALAEGQAKAFELLLQRLTLSEHRPRIGVVDGARLAALIQGFEIARERASATRYVGEMTVLFRSAQVRKLLRDAAVPYSETEAAPLLIVPVFEQGADLLLWEEVNPWRSAWAGVVGGGAIVPLVLPAGDLGDSALLDAGSAISGDKEKIARLAGRYGLNDVLVAFARIEPAGPNSFLNVKLMRNGVAQPPHRIELGAIALPPPPAGQVGGQTAGQAGVASVDDLTGAVKSIVRDVEEQWKRQTLLQFDALAQMLVTVALSEIGDLVQVRERLAKSSEVNGVDLISLNRVAAVLRLHYYGVPERLQLGLAQRNLDLVSENGAWRLGLRDFAAPSTPSPATPSTATQSPAGPLSNNP